MGSTKKIHFAQAVARNVRPACSPVWVDSNSNITCEMTAILSEVTCLACPKTKTFKKAMARKLRAEAELS